MPLKLENVYLELKLIPRRDYQARIAYLREQLLLVWPPEDMRALRMSLISELQSSGENAEALRFLLHETEIEPNEPFHWLCLAEHFHYYDIDLQRSINYIAIAISKARVDGKFLYQALGIQARLSIETENWKLLEKTLQELATYEHRCGDVDVFPETDFLQNIPAGVISRNVIFGYEERVNYLRSIGYSTLTPHSSGTPNGAP